MDSIQNWTELNKVQKGFSTRAYVRDCTYTVRPSDREKFKCCVDFFLSPTVHEISWDKGYEESPPYPSSPGIQISTGGVRGGGAMEKITVGKRLNMVVATIFLNGGEPIRRWWRLIKKKNFKLFFLITFWRYVYIILHRKKKSKNKLKSSLSVRRSSVQGAA